MLGDWAAYFLVAAVFCFGYATVICWAGYGMESVKAITSKKRYALLYLLLFACCIPMGAISLPDAVWDLSDFAIAALTTVNLSVLLLNIREIKRETALAFPTKKDLRSARVSST